MSSQIGTPMRTPRTLNGPGQRARREDALLVEHAVIGQIVLEGAARDLAAIEQQARHCRACRSSTQGAPISTAGPPSAVSARQLLDRLARVVLQRRLQHQIFRRIADDEELGKQDDIGARRALRARAARALARLPAMSPITGLSWASAMRKRSGHGRCLEHVVGKGKARSGRGSATRAIARRAHGGQRGARRLPRSAARFPAPGRACSGGTSGVHRRPGAAATKAATDSPSGSPISSASSGRGVVLIDLAGEEIDFDHAVGIDGAHAALAARRRCGWCQAAPRCRWRRSAAAETSSA